MAEKLLEIKECDEAGNITAIYVQAPGNKDGLSRVDVILPEVTKSPWQKLLDVFLPAGYPHSVTKDYLEYQIYDSLQAFSSSIAGLLSSRAVLASVGVGDSTASPTAALLLSILQESAGRIATILFAHRFGKALEPECKMYRLLADVLNDTAFILDCLSPVLPKPIRIAVLSFSSVLRALCGVAAGSAKASLSAHFARWGNLGELNAKDSSQETVISLLGMLVGSVVVSWVTTPFATWATLIVLLSIHLETNRRAVRAVSMRTFNRQRATLVHYELKRGNVPTPEEISKQERIFERDGALRGPNDQVLGYCNIGVSFQQLLSIMATQQKDLTKATSLASSSLQQFLECFKEQKYLMWFTLGGDFARVNVVIKKHAKASDLLTAWWQALLLTNDLRSVEKSPAHKGPQYGTASDKMMVGLLDSSQETAAEMLRKYRTDLNRAGWDLDLNALETKSSTRVSI